MWSGAHLGEDFLFVSRRTWSTGATADGEWGEMKEVWRTRLITAEMKVFYFTSQVKMLLQNSFLFRLLSSDHHRAPVLETL